ncbi:MAG: S41 family peptidase, partial [Bryobacteraceae bacterium]
MDKIQQLVQEKYYDPNFRGKDWPAIVETHRPRVIAAETNDEFEAAANSMLKELRSGALGLLSAASKISSRNAICASFRPAETPDGLRWVFQDVAPGGPADLAGIQPGNALLEIAGQEILPPTKPSFPMASEIEITVGQPSSKSAATVKIRTPRTKHRDNPAAEPRSVIGDKRKGIAVLKVSLFPGKLGIDVANQVSRLLSTKLSGADHLVIDLRGNPGGGIGGLRLMSFMTPDRLPIGYSMGRNTAVDYGNRDLLPRFGRIPKSKWQVPLLAMKYARRKSVVLQTEGLGPRKFHGRIAVLVNEHTTCAAEMVALFAQERRLATIVGTPTPGRLVSHRGFEIG